MIEDGTLLWTPDEARCRQSNISAYLDWLQRERGLRFADYAQLWTWSVEHPEAFWQSVADYFELRFIAPPQTVLGRREMPGTEWFPGATLNYAEHVFRQAQAGKVAIFHESEARGSGQMDWTELVESTRRMRAALRRLGVVRGDRVCGYLPNIPESVVAFLACASLGAIWSSCSPDFGTSTVLDRFQQTEPKLIIATDGYRYHGKDYDRREVIAELHARIPSIEAVILIPYVAAGAGPLAGDRLHHWAELIGTAEDEPLVFDPLPFDHPLWILYSSGTTGLPKAIVHSHGGLLLEQLKSHHFHFDLKPDSRFFWFTTTGWVMWNVLVGGLLSGASIVQFDGSPHYPDIEVLWRLAERLRVTTFGHGASYLMGCMKAGLEPGRRYDLSALSCVGSTGSPLSADGFAWCYSAIKQDLWVASASGGTDIAGGFVAGLPTLPVHAAEIQCRCLGMSVMAFDEQGHSVIDQVGEMVITRPAPSMPVFFWNDPSFRRYRESYFETYPGVWRHGDFLKITPRGSCIIYGRSDSTLNRYGVRVGTAEVYRVVESAEEVQDSLIVNLDLPGGGFFMPLFLVLKSGVAFDEALRRRLRALIQREISPRHIPDEIYLIDEVPKTLTGKKMEIPVRKILLGAPLARVASPDAMANPRALDYFVGLAAQLAPRTQAKA